MKKIPLEAAGLQKCLEKPSPPDTGTIVFCNGDIESIAHAR